MSEEQKPLLPTAAPRRRSSTPHARKAGKVWDASDGLTCCVQCGESIIGDGALTFSHLLGTNLQYPEPAICTCLPFDLYPILVLSSICFLYVRPPSLGHTILRKPCTDCETHWGQMDKSTIASCVVPS